VKEGRIPPLSHGPRAQREGLRGSNRDALRQLWIGRGRHPRDDYRQQSDVGPPPLREVRGRQGPREPGDPERVPAHRLPGPDGRRGGFRGPVGAGAMRILRPQLLRLPRDRQAGLPALLGDLRAPPEGSPAADPRGHESRREGVPPTRSDRDRTGKAAGSAEAASPAGGGRGGFRARGGDPRPDPRVGSNPAVVTPSRPAGVAWKRYSGS
jgi:hypothetical protein